MRLVDLKSAHSVLASLEQDQRVCQYFPCRSFDFGAEVLRVSLQKRGLFLVENQRVSCVDLRRDSGVQKWLVHEFRSEVVTQAEFTQNAELAYFLLERSGGRVQRVARLDLGSGQVDFSSNLGEGSAHRVHLQFRKKVASLDFESYRVIPTYQSRLKIKFFGCGPRPKCWCSTRRAPSSSCRPTGKFWKWSSLATRA